MRKLQIKDFPGTPDSLSESLSLHLPSISTIIYYKTPLP